MEKTGLVRALEYIQTNELVIDTLVTDRHRQLAKLLREDHPDMKHLFDIWHIAKGNDN
jgi:hypothetical protein